MAALASNIYLERQTQNFFDPTQSSPTEGSIQQHRRQATPARLEEDANGAEYKVDHRARNLQRPQDILSPQNGDIACSRDAIVKMDGFQPNRKGMLSGPKSAPRYEYPGMSDASSIPRNLAETGSLTPHESASQLSTDGTESELDVDIQARQVRARDRLRILRGRVLRTRRMIKDRRKALQHLREAFLDAGANLSRKIEEAVALGDVDALRTIIPYHQKLQLAKDDLGPKEEEFDRLESRLDDEEEDLEEEEDHFIRHNEISTMAVPESELDEELSPFIKPYDPILQEVENLSLENELVREYLGRVTEAERLKEELEGLEEDYYRLSKDSAFRKRHNVPVPSETNTFFEDYSRQHEDTLEELRATEDHLFYLREKCIEQHLFSEHDYRYELHDALKEDIMDTVNEALDRFPLHVAVEQHRYTPKTTEDIDTKDSVNNWLLDWVQDSAFESFIFRTFIDSELVILGAALKGEDWAALALQTWDKDEAGESATQTFLASKMDTIEGYPRKRGASTAQRTGFSGTLSLDLEDEDVARHEDALIDSDLDTSVILERRASSLPPLRTARGAVDIGPSSFSFPTNRSQRSGARDAPASSTDTSQPKQ